MNDFADLARDFEKAPAKIASGLFDAFRGAGEGFRDDWQHNAQATSGEHGKHYPNAITTEMRTGALTSIEVETGPESGKRQGGMGPGFEFGSQNQPPHLDGLRAMPLAERRLDRLADAAIGFALP
ncbi:MAG: hypothetical protein J7518_20490 [Nocardioidaceae bacterium]|nr:hypothetical protein [Nocardioidaceae bacterium]